MLFFFYLITLCLAAQKELVPLPQKHETTLNLLKKLKGSKNNAMLETLISALSSADPDAVNHVKSLVQALIDAGEAEREQYTQTRDDRQQEFDDASASFDGAVDEHTTVAGELNLARDEVTRLTDLKAVHWADQEAAQSAFNDAEDNLASAEQHLAEETARIDSEHATLLEIRRLLDTLLGETPVHDHYMTHQGEGSGSSVLTDKNEARAVRCCADEDNGNGKWDGGSPFFGSCNVFGTSLQDEPDANYTDQCRTLNWEGARDACAEIGGRLCTVAEIVADCVTNTGCGANAHQVWTSDWE